MRGASGRTLRPVVDVGQKTDAQRNYGNGKQLAELPLRRIQQLPRLEQLHKLMAQGRAPVAPSELQVCVCVHVACARVCECVSGDGVYCE